MTHKTAIWHAAEGLDKPALEWIDKGAITPRPQPIVNKLRATVEGLSLSFANTGASCSVLVDANTRSRGGRLRKEGSRERMHERW
jgi:hypothetical protein